MKNFKYLWMIIAVFLSFSPACMTKFDTEEDSEEEEDAADVDTDRDMLSERDAQDLADGTDTDPNCGNGVVDEGEECDDGANGDNNDGCTDGCMYSCHDNAECLDEEPCNGDERCNTDAHVCEEGTPLMDGYEISDGPPRIICLDGVSHESYCGDGFVDLDAGEFCDPPGEGNCLEDCFLACEGDEDCPDDDEVCNGQEYCNMTTRVCDRRNPAAAGTPCNDHQFCTEADECNGTGECVGSGNPCDDGVPCTQDLCNEGAGSCENPVESGFCYINDECMDNNTGNPDNSCQICDSGVDQGAWTNRPPGSNCASDGLTCTEDICNAAGECMHNLAPGNCLIGGVCYGDGEEHPYRECLFCDAYGPDPNDWTPKDRDVPCTQNGTFCDGEEICDGNGACISPGNPCASGSTCWEEEETCCIDDHHRGCGEDMSGIFWFDECNHQQELIEDCHNSPTAGQYGVCMDGPPPECACQPGWFGPACDACRRYVDLSVSGGDGLTWATAFDDIQTALDNARDNGCAEVWVRADTYSIGATGASVELRSGVALYGGFAGGETELDARDWRTNRTTLNGTSTLANVVRCTSSGGCDITSRIDGFTIANGHSTVPSSRGGGMYVYQSSPTIANCTFRNNTSNGGGAMYLSDSDARVINCKFGNNRSENNGGGVNIYGMDTDYSEPYFENCLFWENSADNMGGGMHIDNFSHPKLMNCTLVDNMANDNGSSGSNYGGGIRLWHVLTTELTITNSIVYFNTYTDDMGSHISSQIDCVGIGCKSNIHIRTTDIEDGCTGCDDLGGLLARDPEFVNRTMDNYHLGSASPCIDMGDDRFAPTHDLDGIERYDLSGTGIPDVVTDHGCYECVLP